MVNMTSMRGSCCKDNAMFMRFGVMNSGFSSGGSFFQMQGFEQNNFGMRISSFGSMGFQNPMGMSGAFNPMSMMMNQDNAFMAMLMFQMMLAMWIHQFSQMANKSGRNSMGGPALQGSNAPGTCGPVRENGPSGVPYQDGPVSGGSAFDTAYRQARKWEGGLSNDPDDAGGLTNKGVTNSEYQRYLKRKGLPARSVRHITEAEVREIYHGYWKDAGCDKLPDRLAIAMFDTALNMGVGAAKKLLRESGGDLNRFMQLREQRYRSIATRRNNQKFLKGWLNRHHDLENLLRTV